MQIPIISGIYSDEQRNLKASYPRNLIPTAEPNGISAGYLKPADGIVTMGTGPGIDRGGINWNGKCYRVMGTKLVMIDEKIGYTEIGDVGSGGQVSMAYSFDYLAVASGGNLFLYDSITFSQNTDEDLGRVDDVIWIDGYFMTTDCENLVVTELGDPFSVNPLKYGSSEINPDKIMSILKLRNEVYAVNRYTIEILDNVGSALFPFRRVNGAHMERGAIGMHTSAVFMDAIAFLGSGMNETTSVWIGNNGQTSKLATHAIDLILKDYTEDELSDAVVEAVSTQSHSLLLIHLSDKTIAYDAVASKEFGKKIWFTLTSTITGGGVYKARNFVNCYDKWIVADPTSSKFGYMSDEVSTHYGETTGWDFNTAIVYNGGNGAIFHELELVALTGRVAVGASPVIWTSYSNDGETYSQSFGVNAGTTGNRTKRIVWLRQGIMRHWRIQKFMGTSDANISPIRLEVRLEQLSE